MRSFISIPTLPSAIVSIMIFRLVCTAFSEIGSFISKLKRSEYLAARSMNAKYTSSVSAAVSKIFIVP